MVWYPGPPGNLFRPLMLLRWVAVLRYVTVCFGHWCCSVPLWNKILVARRSRVALGEKNFRMSKKPAASTSRTHSVQQQREEGDLADGFCNTKLSHHGTADVARSYQPAVTPKAGKVTWPYAAEGLQGAAATSITGSCALLTAADAAGLCAVCFAADARGWRK